VPATVGQGVVYVVNSGGTLRAFDATGTSGCSGSPKVCTAMWTFAPGGSGYVTSSSPAIANGLVYFLSTTSTLYAVDAAGSINCTCVPKTCVSLWSATAGVSGSGSPAVVDGVVQVERDTVNAIYAYR
jgi:outer membrane protein assembly factor BamB